MMMNLLNKFYPIALSILRMVAGFLFWQHGVQKLFGWFGDETVPTFSLFWFAGLLETIGGPLIAIGWLTRPAAFVLAGEMVVAYLRAHAPRGFWPLRNDGELALLFLIIFLVLLTAGPGKIAVDRLLPRTPALYTILDKFTPATRALFRIATGILFWQHGASKFGFLGGRVAEFPDLRWFAGVLEFFGGPLIALGLFTRPLAFLLSGEMATAFWTSHVPRGQGFWPIQNAGEPAVLFCFIYLFFVTAGPGQFSLDGLFFRKSAAQ